MNIREANQIWRFATLSRRASGAEAVVSIDGEGALRLQPVARCDVIEGSSC
jgi:hypothetical protein